ADARDIVRSPQDVSCRALRRGGCAHQILAGHPVPGPELPRDGARPPCRGPGHRWFPSRASHRSSPVAGTSRFARQQRNHRVNPAVSPDISKRPPRGAKMLRTRTIRCATICATLALAGAALGTVAAPAAAGTTAATPQSTACPTGWGSLPETGTPATATPVRDIRTGRHACSDRMVVDVPGAGNVGYSVRYVDRLHQDGSGRPVPVAGGAVLEVRITAPAYDPATGRATYPAQAGRTLPGVDLTGYRTFRDARFAGSFEGDTQVGLGVRARLPFRVLQLPDRVVIDVAHNWTGAR